MVTAGTVGPPSVTWHTRGTWPGRDDRLPSLVWLALIWFGMLAGFSADMPRFLHENPSAARVVDIHAFVFSFWIVLLTAQILLVVSDRVAVHRRLGWVLAGWACIMAVLGPWAALTAKGPVPAGPASPQFLAIQFGGITAFLILLAWGISLRKNPAAHKRIMILATVAILDPGYARLSLRYLHEPQSILAWYFFIFYGNVFLIALMAVWDAWRGRLMKQFAFGVIGLIAFEFLQDFLYHWGPWKVYTTGLVAAWARRFG